MGNLRRHRFLYLQPACECLDDACEFTDADDVAVGQVANVNLADNRCHVMLAVRLEADVAQHDHLIVAVYFIECAA